MKCFYISWASGFSDIRYFKGDESDFPFTASEIEEQKRILYLHDPIADSKKAHRLFNNRFIGVKAVELFLPGLKYELLNYNDKTRAIAIWGLSDVNPDSELEVLAWRYSYLYNQNIIKLTNREELLGKLEPYQIKYIKLYFPDFTP